MQIRTRKRTAAMRACLLLAVGLLLAGCGGGGSSDAQKDPSRLSGTSPESVQASGSASAGDAEKPARPSIDLSSVPEYSGDPYVELNGNVPSFTDAEMVTDSFETYSPLDSLGRCGAAYACIGEDLMPTEERSAIGQIKPAGWHTVKYDIVDGKYLYNRCHLIGYQLTAENANERNLITGTYYLNVEGMLPFENLVADYIHETGNHVLYRVTPIYDGDNLLASGVQMESKSVEDAGDGVLYNVYVYNVQPGIAIDYATGDSRRTEETPAAAEPRSTDPPQKTEAPAAASPAGASYVLNTNTKKFHVPSCSSVGQIKDSNRQDYTGSREELIRQGYDPCKRCRP